MMPIHAPDMSKSVGGDFMNVYHSPKAMPFGVALFVSRSGAIRSAYPFPRNALNRSTSHNISSTTN